ncbi:hypothetical protein [Fusobacterium sp.]|uniref:hypothetical protein n=1 Tax=Fusobacterium sp. TaxID=68766 RepID=UPI0025C47F21|nr:hypothetical protein [Fusobacterium sp.]MCI7224239.1 hypothetical protein [Fusobacterium sp.]
MSPKNYLNPLQQERFLFLIHSQNQVQVKKLMASMEAILKNAIAQNIGIMPI